MVLGKELVGKITHYYDKINVAIVELSASLKVGDKVSIEKEGQNAVEQKVESMQIEHENVQKAGKGQGIGLKVMQAVKPGSQVFKITEE